MPLHKPSAVFAALCAAAIVPAAAFAQDPPQRVIITTTTPIANPDGGDEPIVLLPPGAAGTDGVRNVRVLRREDLPPGMVLNGGPRLVAPKYQYTVRLGSSYQTRTRDRGVAEGQRKLAAAQPGDCLIVDRAGKRYLVTDAEILKRLKENQVSVKDLGMPVPVPQAAAQTQGGGTNPPQVSQVRILTGKAVEQMQAAEARTTRIIDTAFLKQLAVEQPVAAPTQPAPAAVVPAAPAAN